MLWNTASKNVWILVCFEANIHSLKRGSLWSMLSWSNASNQSVIWSKLAHRDTTMWKAFFWSTARSFFATLVNTAKIAITHSDRIWLQKNFDTSFYAILFVIAVHYSSVLLLWHVVLMLCHVQQTCRHLSASPLCFGCTCLHFQILEFLTRVCVCVHVHTMSVVNLDQSPQ